MNAAWGLLELLPYDLWCLNFHLPSSWLCAVCILALWWLVCLFPPRLGAWQFLADMPYGSVSLTAIWKVFWSLYSNHTDPTLSAYQTASGHHDNSGSVERDGPVAAERGRSPETVEEIQQAMKSESRKLFDVSVNCKCHCKYIHVSGPKVHIPVAPLFESNVGRGL